eukprot:TRINITY_DN90885_c0_g1_i1.p1 TRINITY_DN90885_c0_g1~~TRINITY_DN90885_c0_g1_i1.p1  ORF type:complete len:221 (+),score=20.83 TRINITY_DN90885_c0_g1_i1:49-711(+)
MAARVHGTCPYLMSDNEIKAEAEFYHFAPLSCALFGCLVNDETKARMFARIYDNRIVMNHPIAPFCCCTTPICIADSVTTFFYDKPPFRAGPCGPPCCCVPCTCCGPPVMFSYNPKCCCIDLKDMCGSQVKVAPANLYGCRSCICLGQPCYVNCSVPLLTGVKNADAFICAAKARVDGFKNKHGLPEAEMTIFEFVSDNISLAGVELGSSRRAPGQEEMS